MTMKSSPSLKTNSPNIGKFSMASLSASSNMISFAIWPFFASADSISDTDVFFAVGLRELLTHSCVFPFEELTLSRRLRRQYQMDWEIGNYGFGAIARHPFLNAIIQNCIRAQQDPRWVKPMMQGIPRLFQAEFHVLNTTGPGLVSRTLAENPDLAEDVTILFPEDVCDESTWHHFGNLGVHTQEGSWRSKNGYLRRRLANLWEVWARRRLLRESLALGPARAGTQ